ncbi:MAG TPA: DUF3175 domain-containing protein [Dongiaceae bacterium]|jgi:hypothetical protein
MVTRRKTAGRKAARRKTAHRGAGGSKGSRWSARVTKHSDALDLEKAVFKSSDPHRIALSLKRSAERSRRRKASPYQSAMSMLTFYINRAGRNLPKRKLRTLREAKTELRKVFRRE